jgi:hypothetical protein
LQAPWYLFGVKKWVLGHGVNEDLQRTDKMSNVILLLTFSISFSTATSPGSKFDNFPRPSLSRILANSVPFIQERVGEECGLVA